MSDDILKENNSTEPQRPQGRRIRQKKLVIIVALAVVAILVAAALMNGASPRQSLVYPVPKESQHGLLAPDVTRTFLQEDEFNFNLTQGTHVNMTLALKAGGPNGIRAILGPVDDKGNQEPPYLYTTTLKQVGSIVTWTGTIAVSAGYRIELTNMDMTEAAVRVYFWAS